MLTVILTSAVGPSGLGPDTSELPPGVEIAASSDQLDGTFKCDLDGDDHSVLASIGVRLATDPKSQVIRAIGRQSLDRYNRFADAIGRPDLKETEEQAIARLIQSLLSGGGLPEPPEPEEP